MNQSDDLSPFVPTRYEARLPGIVASVSGVPGGQWDHWVSFVPDRGPLRDQPSHTAAMEQALLTTAALGKSLSAGHGLEFEPTRYEWQATQKLKAIIERYFGDEWIATIAGDGGGFERCGDGVDRTLAGAKAAAEAAIALYLGPVAA